MPDLTQPVAKETEAAPRGNVFNEVHRYEKMIDSTLPEVLSRLEDRMMGVLVADDGLDNPQVRAKLENPSTLTGMITSANDCLSDHITRLIRLIDRIDL